jgi:hypothetical protein
MPSDDIFLPLPVPRDAVPRAYSVRSTVLISSMRGLRAHGRFDDYVAALAPPHRDAMLSITAGRWFPIDVALAHYTACDRLEIDLATLEKVGFESGRYINQNVLKVLLRLSRDAGMSPWSALGQTNRLVARLWQGSAVEVRKLGPKEARLEWVGQPCAQSPYFATAFASFVEGIVTLFCQRAYVRLLGRLGDEETLFYRVQWA